MVADSASTVYALSVKQKEARNGLSLSRDQTNRLSLTKVSILAAWILSNTS